MTIFQSILLGIVQGLTEFLPISSSGHLVLVPHLFGWHIPTKDAFVFNVLVQLATLIAVFAYFWGELVQITKAFFDGLAEKRPFESPRAREGWFILLATIPALIIGLVLKNIVEEAFTSLTATALFLFVTSGLLLIAERIGKRNRDLDHMHWKDALMIGIFQALAIFPGISRSGASITGGMKQDLDRPSAARFSFLMSIPVMIAAGAAATLDMTSIPNFTSLLPAFIPGFFTAAVVGYLAIRWLLKFLADHPLYVFSIYCAAVGLLALGLGFIGR
jgi:undecaprenyl-diphosphatase